MLNIKNLLKITKSQLFTGLALSASLLFYAGLEACEETKSNAPAVTAPVARWESPSMRRRREAAAAEAAATSSHVPTHSLESLIGPTATSIGFAIIDIGTLADTDRATAPSDPSPLEPASVRSSIISRRSILKSPTTPTVETVATSRHKSVSFAAIPEIREFDPQSLTYAEEIAMGRANQAKISAREKRIAEARGADDASDISDLGASVRSAFETTPQRLHRAVFGLHSDYLARLNEVQKKYAKKGTSFEEGDY